MNRRFMRLIVLFDLPMTTKKEVNAYTNFRKFLLKNGFIMMQQSVYCRLVVNGNSAKLMREQIQKNLPNNGLIQLMQITEKQYADIEYLLGKSQSKIIESTDRVVEL